MRSKMATGTADIPTSVALIRLRLPKPDGTCAIFKIQKTAKLGNLMNVYCQKYNVPRNRAIFQFNQIKVDPMDTASSLCMEDLDWISVFLTSNAPNVNSAVIRIGLRRPDNTYIIFVIRTTTQLENLMSVYCQKYNVPRSHATFLFRHSIVTPTDTTSSLGMEEGDCIIVFH